MPSVSSTPDMASERRAAVSSSVVPRIDGHLPPDRFVEKVMLYVSLTGKGRAVVCERRAVELVRFQISNI